MNSLFSIDIPKRQVVCSHQGEKLLPEMTIFSLLNEDENQKIIRRDFCEQCWKHVYQEEDIQHSRGFWKSKLEKKKKNAQGSRTDQALIILQMLITNPQANEAEIYVLSLFLAHAKRLILREEFKEDETTFHRYQIAKTHTFVTIKVVYLSQLEIETIQLSIAQKLQEIKDS